MKQDDPGIEWVEEPKLGLAGKMYLPLVTQGLTTTLKHLKRTVAGAPVTVSYPDEEPEIDEDTMPPDLITALLEPLHPPRLYRYGGGDFDEHDNVIEQHPEVAARMRDLAVAKWPEAPV